MWICERLYNPLRALDAQREVEHAIIVELFKDKKGKWNERTRNDMPRYPFGWIKYSN